MARPESEAKAGYFPAPPEAIEGICQHITAKKEDLAKGINILDPCAGKGAAIKQIAAHLGIPSESVWCVELDSGRAAECREALPGAHVLGPSSFKATTITARSFGLIYCNPPFSTELGGGKREEQVFAEKCLHHLAPRGTLVMVLPINAIAGNTRFVQFMDSRYCDIAVYRFPDDHRQYREIVMFCQRRVAALGDNMLSSLGCLHKLGWNYGYYNSDAKNFPRLGDFQPESWASYAPSFDREVEVRLHHVPHTWKPSRFDKSGYSDDAELMRDINASPLNGRLVERNVVDSKVVPMSISRNHLSMLLASGELDGAVYFFDEAGAEIIGLRHVVRGVTSKVFVYNEDASTVTVDEEDECLRVKHVYSQKIKMHTNAFDADGKLHKFTEDDDTDAEPDWRDKKRAAQEATERPTNYGGYPDSYDFDLAAKLARMTVDNGCTPEESATAQARLRCMKEGKKFVPEEWTEYMEEYIANNTKQGEAA